MKYRLLGKTGYKISEVSLGTWQVGGKWGSGFNENTAAEILNKAIDSGINFIDTADVYEGGLSEKAVGKAVKFSDQKIYIATKCGRQINPHTSEGYTPKALRTFVESSLKNLDLEIIDLIQLHCPPTEVYYRPEIFSLFDDLKKEGKIGALGVSVEKVEEGLKAIEYDNVDTVQIIFNMFRQRPNELFFEQAKKKNIGIIARVPLASGLLTGKFSRNSEFHKDDHRNFNRNGEVFDKGETFSGVDFELGLKAVKELEDIFGTHLTQAALKWVLMHDEVSCVIPGASKLTHLVSNIKASDYDLLSEKEMSEVRSVYETYIRNSVHHLW
ncbi:MAG: aldo/keto reductase [Cyclobacteriaceae bacterium]